MSFVLEDGTGLANSTSYASVAEWKSYWTDGGFDFSSYTDPQIQIALMRATRYIEQVYRNRFIGYRTLPTQALSWPRVAAYVNCIVVTGVPTNLKYATSEYAKRALATTAELLPDPADTDATGQIIGATEKTVGPITLKTSYNSVGALSFQSYPAADKWLADLIFSGQGVVRN